MRPIIRQPTFSAGQTSRFSNIQTVVTSSMSLSSCFLVLKHCGGSSPGCSDSAPLGCSPQIMFNSPPALLRLTPPCVNPIKLPRIAAYWSLLLRRRWRRDGAGVWNQRGSLDIQLSFRLHFHWGLICFVSYARRSMEKTETTKPKKTAKTNICSHDAYLQHSEKT